MYLRAIGLLIMFSFSSMSMAGEMNLPDDVEAALDSAGSNRAEIEKVFAHYQSEADSLKFKAAEFLVANMDGHGYVTYYMHDTTGTKIDFNVLDYPDYDALLAACDTLKENKGEFDFKKDEMIEDLQVITSDYLINQIDYAFRAWQEKPWAQGFDFDSFCRYILPYRGSNEPLEDWRKYFWDKYQDIAERMKDPSDPIEAAAIINDDIKSYFGFDPRFYYHPTDQGLSEMLTNGLGRCEDMTNLAIYALRANGLGVTSDYTPFWANSGNNHAWNAIATADGRVIPFMGAEADPGTYKLANKLGKVYRKTYEKHPENLIFQTRKQKSVPRWLAGKSYIDVTSDYTVIDNIYISFAREIPDSVDVAYLCVFNSGEWKAIQWAFIQAEEAGEPKNVAFFESMGSDGIAYLPALYLNEEIVGWAPPLILYPDKSSTYLEKQDSKTISVSLVSTTKRKLEVSTDGIAKTYLDPGKEYELFYWDDGWQSLGKQIASDKPLVFDNVPAGCLYWLVEVDSDKEERIFTIENGNQVWW